MYMEATDCKAGKDFRNNLIQSLYLADKESESQGGLDLTQGHTAGNNFVCFKN